MLTVENLVADLGFELAAGEAGAASPIRWVHITELRDPTPWLSGGELLLSTGIQLADEDEQRAFVQRLAGHGLTGLGLGTGFRHAELPEAMVEEAQRLGFPLFEVPYETPFIAITEKAFATLVNEQYDVLRRGIETHKRLERLVLEERGLDEVVRALAAAIGGAALVLDARGQPMSAKAFRGEVPEEQLASITAELTGRDETFAPSHPGLAGRALALPVIARAKKGTDPLLANAAPQAWLVAVRMQADGGEAFGDFERLILQQAVTVVALELMRRRVVLETERRLAGDVLAEALTGRLTVEELEPRLRPFGVGAEAAVAVFRVEDPAAAAPVLDTVADEVGAGAVVAARDGLLCAIVDARAADPGELARRACDALGGVRGAVSRPAPVDRLRRAFHEARLALEAARVANGDGPPVATWRDLGAFQLLLAVQDDEALRVYCDSVLGPLQGDYGDELLRSLEAFIEQNGHWERAARDLFCHRHTLRYRIRRVEELTGRDLSRARDRIEFWLALRGRELVK